MKKELLKMKFLCLLVLSIMLVSVSAEENKMEAFSQYQEDATDEHFFKAYEELSENGNQVFLSYLLHMEMNRQLEKVDTENLNPRNSFLYANLLLELGKYEECIPQYDKLNEATPKLSCPWRHKGEAYYKMQNYEQAEIALKKAIETRIEHYDAYIWLAKVQKEMGKYKEALKTFETGISYKGKDIEDPEEEVHPLDEMFLELELLQLNEKTKEYQEAKMKAMEIAPDDERWETLNLK